MSQSNRRAPAVVEVFRLSRTPTQIGELRSLCLLWGPSAFGNERFWAFEDILEALSRPGSLAVFVADRDDAAWQGVAFVDAGPDAADLLYIYVRSGYRQRGVARLLLKGVIAQLVQTTAVENLFLEVRTGNLGAQVLYESTGLERIGLRRRYYADGEDALVYQLKIPR